MSALSFLARLQLKRRYRALAVLAVVLGVVGGVSTSLIAGARRRQDVGAALRAE
jgi:hypothetical protein